MWPQYKDGGHSQIKRAVSEATGGVHLRFQDTTRYGKKVNQRNQTKSRCISKSVQKHHKNNPRVIA